MNCQEFWDDLPRPGHEITQSQSAHLTECATCAAQWTPHRALAAGLHSIAEEWRQTEAPPRVEAGLMASFRAQAGYQVQRSFARSWWTPVVAWASAAAATIALAVVLVRGYQPAPAGPGRVAAPHRTVLPVAEMASAEDDDTSALGEGFVRLPNAPRIESNEDYNVVRVEVPGSAMIAAGISLGEDRAAETVLADVALAADGTPRAVRLVPEGGTY
jgi:hypothetical protein